MRFAIGGVEGNDPIAAPRPHQRSPRTSERRRPPRTGIAKMKSASSVGAARPSRARIVHKEKERAPLRSSFWGRSAER